MSEGVAPTPKGLMDPDLDLALQNMLASHEGRMILAEFLKTMYFLATITGGSAEQTLQLAAVQEGSVVWYERMFSVNRNNTLQLIGEHFMEGGDG